MGTSSLLGKFGENAAYEYLKSKKYKVIARNFHSRFGEIDIIAREDSCLVFVEVKQRNSTKYGLPEESIGKAKLQRIIKTISWFFIKFPTLKSNNYRIDAITILRTSKSTEIKHFKNIG